MSSPLSSNFGPVDGPRRGKSTLSAVKSVLAASVATAFMAASIPAAAADLQRLQDLLAPLPAGSWVQANTGAFSAAWPTGSVAVQGSYGNPASIVTAWSSFAWDSARGNLLLFGGGHATYAGNEVYVWSGQTGQWSLGSLPSLIDANGYVPDNSAPQSTHTYDTNTYLPLSDRMMVFGGAAFPQGNQTQHYSGITGPWLWNPGLASSTKVGGADYTGYDPLSLGGNMWTNRAPQVTGTAPATYVNSASAMRIEGGQEVIYITGDQYQSGWPVLYRYAVGQGGQGDSWQLVGVNGQTAPGFSGAAAIDSTHSLFVRTAAASGWNTDFMVWKLSGAAGAPDSSSVGVTLKFSDGSDFDMTTFFGVDYDPTSGMFYLWDSLQGGVVYAVQPGVDSAGNVLSQWLVTRLTPANAGSPQGHYYGVFGKWQYVQELDAFVALGASDGTDAQVWLYKPLDSVAAVPEPHAALLMMIGLTGLMVMRRRARGGVAPSCS